MSEDLLKNLQQAVILKESSALARNIKWPSGIKLPHGMNDGNGCCKMFLSKELLTANMQEDAAAFEGWALIVKAWLIDKGIRTVELSWENTNILLNGNGHYQRFLYRVIRFLQLFDWFSVSAESQDQLTESRILKTDGTVKSEHFYLNTEGERKVPSPTTNAKISREDFLALSEQSMELLFIANKKPLLKCVIGSDDSALERQLPVGVFEGLPSAQGDAPVFSRGKSAIDLWTNNKEKVILFELKKPTGNKRVGALSELFFYVNVINDLKNGDFKIIDDKKKEKINGKTIEGYLLLGENNLHPLLSKEVLVEINKGLAKINCTIGLISYGYSEEHLVWCKKEYPI